MGGRRSRRLQAALMGLHSEDSAGECLDQRTNVARRFEEAELQPRLSGLLRVRVSSLRCACDWCTSSVSNEIRRTLVKAAVPDQSPAGEHIHSVLGRSPDHRQIAADCTTTSTTSGLE